MFCYDLNCPRNKTNCDPLSNILSDNGETFVCCGHSHSKSRSVPQDEFRCCFVSETTDSCFDYDKTDLTDQIMVFSAALAASGRGEYRINEEGEETIFDKLHKVDHL